jgi:hypothetical protein
VLDALGQAPVHVYARDLFPPLGNHLRCAHRYMLPVCNRGLRAAPDQKVQPLIAAELHTAHERLAQHVAGSIVDLVIGHHLSGPDD